MKRTVIITVTIMAMLISPVYAGDARPLYDWMKALDGEWVLSPVDQQEMLVDLSSTGDKLVYKCDMSTELCQSGQDHVHNISHELSSDGKHLKTTYISWKDGKYLKDSAYHFDRK